MAFKYIDGEIIEIEHETVSGRLVEVSALDSFENKLLITLRLKGQKYTCTQIISVNKEARKRKWSLSAPFILK